MKPLPDYDPTADLDQGLDVPGPDTPPAFDRWDAIGICIGILLLILESQIP